METEKPPPGIEFIIIGSISDFPDGTQGLGIRAMYDEASMRPQSLLAVRVMMQALQSVPGAHTGYGHTEAEARDMGIDKLRKKLADEN